MKKKVINKCARVGVMMFILVLGTMGAMALDSSTFPADQPTAVWEEESVIVSNRHPGGHRTWSNDLYQFPIKNRIYDIGLIAYSQWFADQYGYPYEYVSKEMGEDGLHFVEFQFFSYQEGKEMNN